MPYSILIVDSDPASRLVMERVVSESGFHPVCAECGEEALDFVDRHAPALMCMELCLPDMDGFDVCRRLRCDSTIPIIVLTHRDSAIDRIVALELGADDFVSKPFRPNELSARIESLLDRTYNGGRDANGSPALHFEDLTIRPSEHEVQVRGEPVHLTPKEFELLLALARSRRKVVSSEWLLLNIWGYDGNIRTRTLDVHINRLRGKIEPEDEDPHYIQTVQGVGYKFTAEAA